MLLLAHLYESRKNMMMHFNFYVYQRERIPSSDQCPWLPYWRQSSVYSQNLINDVMDRGGCSRFPTQYVIYSITECTQQTQMSSRWGWDSLEQIGFEYFVMKVCYSNIRIIVEYLWTLRSPNLAHLYYWSIFAIFNTISTKFPYIINLELLEPASTSMLETDSSTSWFYCQHSLVSAFVFSTLGYCNTVLAGLPSYTITPVQRVENAAAKLVAETSWPRHICIASTTDYLQTLFAVHIGRTPSYIVNSSTATRLSLLSSLCQQSSLWTFHA